MFVFDLRDSHEIGYKPLMLGSEKKKRGEKTTTLFVAGHRGFISPSGHFYMRVAR